MELASPTAAQDVSSAANSNKAIPSESVVVVPVDQTPRSGTSLDSIAPVARQSNVPSNSVVDEIFGDSPTTTPFSGSQLDAVSSPAMADTLANPSEPSPLYANDFDFAAVETQYESESVVGSDPLMPDFMQNDDILGQPSALRAPSPANDVVEPNHLQNVTGMAQSPSVPDLAPTPGNMQNDLDSLSQSMGSYAAGMPVSSPAGSLQSEQATGSTSMVSNSVSSQSSSIDALPGISGDVVGASAFPAAQTISGPMATNCVCKTESAHRDL